MPLGCDCYGGCWGDHSAEWPHLRFPTEAVATEAWRRCHQVADSYDTKVLGKLTHGTYVLSGKYLRFESDEVKARWQKYNEKFLRDPIKATSVAKVRLERSVAKPLKGR